MGDPRKSKKLFSRPMRPYDKDRIASEKELMRKFGLRRKNEIYRAESILRDIRRRVRLIIATKDKEAEKTLLQKVVKMGLLKEKEVSIDSILSLNIENYLERRLETQVVRKELANSYLQARQFIVHGHIFVNNLKVTSPKYLVGFNEEDSVSYSSRSSLVSGFKYKPKKVKVREERDSNRRFGSRRPGGRPGGRPPFRGRTDNRSATAPKSPEGGVKK